MYLATATTKYELTTATATGATLSGPRLMAITAMNGTGAGCT